MPNPNLPHVPVTLAASGAVCANGDGRLHNVIITTSSSLTIKIWDNGSAASGNVLLGTTAAITAPFSLPVCADFGTGCYIQFVAGTGTLTAYYSRT